MKLKVDKEADALCLRLDDSPIFEPEEVSPGVVLDYNESNEVVGVEMVHCMGGLRHHEATGVLMQGLVEDFYTRDGVWSVDSVTASEIDSLWQ